MPTPSELRAQCRLTKEAFARETDPLAKRKLARQGFALAQLAQKIERDEMARQSAQRLRA
jgi:hypothetical protein